jgi:hypothetical protein
MTQPGSLKGLLADRRPVLLKEWVRQVVDTYPADARRFLNEQKDSFANPVGRTLAAEMENLLQEIIDGPDSERVIPILDKIIRVRAVQDFQPSETVGFILELKGLIRDQLKEENQGDRFSEEMAALESRIDDLLLVAFDVYMRCRETIFEIRADQAKRQVSGLLQRAGLISEIPPWKPKTKEGRSSS